jgi:uncharacterized membrane protein YfcA
MFEAISRKQIQQSLVVGLLAGILAGMFGVGGGFLMVPLYVIWMGLDQRRSHATSLAAVLPIAVAGAIGYSTSGYVDWHAVATLLAGSFFGALYGVKLLSQVSLKFLQLGFATLLYLSAMRLIWSSTPHQLLDGPAAIVFLVIVGFFAGVMSGLFGVGGGIVMVPALIIASGMDSLTARGTSLAVIVGSAISGTVANLRKGNIDVAFALLTGLAGIPATFIGVYLSQQVPQRLALILFSLILIAIATQQARKVQLGSAVH